MTKELLQQALDALEWASDLNQVAVDSFTIHDAITALREAIAAPTPEPVAWQFRWTNPGNNPSVDPSEIEWKTVAPKYPMTSIEDTLANLRAYRFDGKPCYEVRALYAAPPAAPAPVVPLTDEQLARIAVEDEFLLYCDQDSFNEIARAIEQAHGIGGGGNG